MTLAIAKKFDRIVQGHQLYAFVFGMVDFFGAGRHFRFAAAVDERAALQDQVSGAGWRRRCAERGETRV